MSKVFFFILIFFYAIYGINGQDIDLITSIPESTSDTIFVVKKDKYQFKAKESFNNVYFESDFKELILKNKDGKINLLTTSRAFVSVTKDEIIIDLTIGINQFNQDFFISNFPSTKNQVNKNKHYNKIKLGKIIGRLDKNGEIYYDYKFIDKNHLLETDEKEVLKEYQKLYENEKYSKQNCDNWIEAYYLFEKITWLTIIKDSFSVEKYIKLDKLLVPCLGPEHGLDFFMYLELLDLIK